MFRLLKFEILKQVNFENVICKFWRYFCWLEDGLDVKEWQLLRVILIVGIILLMKYDDWPDGYLFRDAAGESGFADWHYMLMYMGNSWSSSCVFVCGVPIREAYIKSTHR